LNASLTGAATTVTFTNAPGFETLVAGEYIPIVLGSSKTSPEIAYVTAYSSGSTTATIARGKEGTAGSTHASGVEWHHGPTAFDWLGAKSLRDPAEAPSQETYFVENGSTTLPSTDWAWRNQVAALAETAGGWFCVYATTANNARIEQAEIDAPSGAWRMRTEVAYIMAPDSFSRAGICFTEPGTTDIGIFFAAFGEEVTGAPHHQLRSYSNVTAGTASADINVQVENQGGFYSHIEIVKNNSSAWDDMDVNVGFGGVYVPYDTGRDWSTFATPTKIGLAIVADNAFSIAIGMRYLRFESV
jgi:hypothetical protein